MRHADVLHTLWLTLAAVASAGGAGWCLLARYKNKNINRRDRE